jgi:serine/threonine protein kinase/formylglycine-generating enzyme required for sulfatase activity
VKSSRTDDTLPIGDDPTAETTSPGSRTTFEDLGLIGVGGMGEVRRVRDLELNRVLAMKVIRDDLLGARSVVARFVEEAQATAQLEHPGIVPVHQLGKLPDGRWFFTMKEVKGETLTAVIDGIHAASGTGFWGTAANGWTFYRLIDAFRRVCEAVAHAHARGVIHRDLKPDNVMVGAYGEVLVLDWGLAKVHGVSFSADPDPELEAVSTARSADRSMQTRIGTVAGTPAYMSPEQARGMIDKLDARSDVFALGAILHEILAGSPAYAAGSALEVLERVKAGPPPPLVPLHGLVPDELVALAERAMARDPAHRPPDAGALATAVGNWLEGAHKRERGLQIVAEAEASLPRMRELRDRAAEARRDAIRALEGIRPYEPIDKKRPAWAAEADAEALETEADLAEIEAVRLLQGALTHAADLPEAHALLADLYRERHAAAEIRRDRAEARRYEVLLGAHDLAQRHLGYLRGEGALSLVSTPVAEAELYQFVERDRRLVAERIATLGSTPIDRVPLSMGSYLVILRAAGHADVRVPVHIGREEHWDGTVAMPCDGELGPDDVFVPPGWFWSGGDPMAPTSLARQRRWVDAFVMRRFPVTNAAYLEFLNELVAAGRADEALRWAPRERAAGGAPGPIIYGQGPDGRFALVPDSDGDVWKPDWPVLLVDWPSASAFAAWRAAMDGLPWRLPTEWEWEKAARGVDGRFYPWGDFADATWACLRESHAKRMLPAAVTDYPTDESPYGVRGMAGNVQVWCADRLDDGGADAPRLVRGAGWSTPLQIARSSVRRSSAPGYRSEVLGVRLVRGIGG